MGSRPRDENGKFDKEVPDEEILNLISEQGTPSAEIREELGLARSTTSERLRELETQGHIHKREIGDAYLWYPAN